MTWGDFVRMRIASALPAMALIVLPFLWAGPSRAGEGERSTATILADAVEHDRALSTSEYLSVLISPQPFEPALLFRAAVSRDASTRRVAAAARELRPDQRGRRRRPRQDHRRQTKGGATGHRVARGSDGQRGGSAASCNNGVASQVQLSIAPGRPG